MKGIKGGIDFGALMSNSVMGMGMRPQQAMPSMHAVSGCAQASGRPSWFRRPGIP